MPLSIGFSKYGLSFDGLTNFVRVPTSLSLAGITSQVTISCFVKLNNLGSVTFVRTPSDLPPIGFGIDAGGGGSLRGFIYDLGVPQIVSTAWTPPLNVWQHVCLRYEGTRISTFLNGTEYAGLNYVGSIDSSVGGINIGASNSTGINNLLNGSINEVLIYKLGLTDDSIRRNMMEYHNPIKSGLVMWLRFEENTGLTAYDLSGNGNNGSLLPVLSPPTWSKNKKWEIRSQVGI
jgi:hypothetical protein